MKIETFPGKTGSGGDSVADACVIMNPKSGDRNGDAGRKAVRAALERHPGRFELRVLESGSQIADATDRAIADGFGIVVAAGGDGTVAGVASRLLGSGRVLGVVPMGTFNFFARSLDLPESIDEAVDLVASGSPVAVPLGDVNGRIFVNNASLGLYPAILQQREEIYRHWGRSRLAAHWSVLMTLARFQHRFTLRLEVDGTPRTVRTPLVFAACNGYQLDLLGLPGGDQVRAGQLALFLVPEGGKLRLLNYAFQLFWRRLHRGENLEMHFCEDVVIESRSRSRVIATDGERARMNSPFRFTIHKDGLHVIARRQED